MTGAPLPTHAVVLRSVVYGEADLVVTLYTRERGKLSALARGARKSRRRFGAALQLFVLGNAELRGRARSELWTLQSFDAVRDFTKLAGDVAAMAHASYGTELVRELTVAEQPDEAVLDLLVELYDELLARGPSPNVLRAFELRLLDTIGLGPVLDRCVACGTDELDDGTVMDGPRGGVCCPACAHPGSHTRPLSAAARAILEHARAAPSLAAARSDEAPAAPEARDAMLATIYAHVGKPLRSVEFIVKMTGASRRHS